MRVVKAYLGIRGLSRLASVALAVGMLNVGVASAQTFGGSVIVAQASNPPSLDAITTNSAYSRNINMHIYETLYTFDENGAPMPMLAEGFEVSEDGKSYTFSLRQGVLFHNGKEMTSSDVVASLERYRKFGVDKSMLQSVESIEATGKYEVRITLSEPLPTFLERLASPLAPAVIIPEEEARKEPNEIEIIGTGPYKFEEYVPDDYVRLTRFEDYVADERFETATGFGGRKIPYFDEVTFRIMPEAGAQTSALEAGEIHVMDSMPVPTARRLENDPNIDVYKVNRWAFLILPMNFKAAPTDNVDFRRAVQAALDMESILAIATEGVYELNHAWQYPDTPYYIKDAGRDSYNLHDQDLAREYLEKSGYDGEEITILTDSAYPVHNRAGVMVAEQLNAIGINAKIRQVDWPTALQIRLQPDGWNIWTLNQGLPPSIGPYNVAGTMTGDAAYMRAKDEGLEEAYQRLLSGRTVEERREAFADFQARLYEIAAVIKIGDIGIMQATRSNVEGFKPYRIPRMYNVWFAEE